MRTSPGVGNFVLNNDDVIGDLCVVKRPTGHPLPYLRSRDQTGAYIGVFSPLGNLTLNVLNASEWCTPRTQCTERSQTYPDKPDALDDCDRVRMHHLMIENGTFGETADQIYVAHWSDAYGMTAPILHGQDVNDDVNEHIFAALGREFGRRTSGMLIHWVQSQVSNLHMVSWVRQRT